jgi:hypothetical protein
MRAPNSAAPRTTCSSGASKRSGAVSRSAVQASEPRYHTCPVLVREPSGDLALGAFRVPKSASGRPNCHRLAFIKFASLTDAEQGSVLRWLKRHPRNPIRTP